MNYYYVRLNKSAIIGDDLMVSSVDDIFNGFPPDPFYKLSEAEDIAEKYDGKVICFVEKTVKTSGKKCCKNCAHMLRSYQCLEDLPMIQRMICQHGKIVLDDGACCDLYEEAEE